MKIKYFCPHWGSGHRDFNQFIKKVKDAGYDGVEMSLPYGDTEKKEILGLLEHHDLLFIAQHWETQTSDFNEHKKKYRNRLENLASGKPLLINSQTGKDFFSFEQNSALIEIADEVSHKHGIKIIHETHRGKFSFSAHITMEYLQKLPNLRIGLDISHWCNVAESFLEDQNQAVTLALSRADHIHARVGFPEGPQVPDPRVPEWNSALLIHQRWWNDIITNKQKSGQDIFTITPEFGPPPYMAIMPFTQQPISDQWQINIFMMEYLKSIFI